MADQLFTPPTNIPQGAQQGNVAQTIALQRLVDASQQTNILLGQITIELSRLTGNIGANYAEGNWTPSLGFGGATVGITYSTQSGTYEVTGRQVACRFDIALSNKGSGSGAATLMGLPATANVTLSANGCGGVVTVYGTMSGLTGVPVLQVSAGSSSVALLSAGATATTPLTDVNFSNASSLSGSFSFII